MRRLYCVSDCTHSERKASDVCRASPSRWGIRQRNPSCLDKERQKHREAERQSAEINPLSTLFGKDCESVHKKWFLMPLISPRLLEDLGHLLHESPFGTEPETDMNLRRRLSFAFACRIDAKMSPPSTNPSPPPLPIKRTQPPYPPSHIHSAPARFVISQANSLASLASCRGSRRGGRFRLIRRLAFPFLCSPVYAALGVSRLPRRHASAGFRLSFPTHSLPPPTTTTAFPRRAPSHSPHLFAGREKSPGAPSASPESPRPGSASTAEEQRVRYMYNTYLRHIRRKANRGLGMRTDKPRQGREGRAASNSLGRTEGEKQRIREHKAASEGLECIPVAAVRAQPLTGSKDSSPATETFLGTKTNSVLSSMLFPVYLSIWRLFNLSPMKGLPPEGAARGAAGRSLSAARPVKSL
ncbi:hypothetical protein C7M84_018045 [Penaeus vannamei]|uniref:Uncharacterized protein n=1 Tax=Penaeus vannamei TaxID=6689 RepID=A0A423SIE7_PENVA|nr:hypothetical protein C7M84_018045 [Penaeus vannamei]